MSRFPKSARHPDFQSVCRLWEEYGPQVNVTDESHLADLAELQVASAEMAGEVAAIAYVAPAREIVCANAIRVVGKGFEALDGMTACGRERINMAAVVQCYGAAFFFARAFCLLMGFAPVDRESKVTVDVFRFSGARRAGDVLEGMRLHRYRRWGHEEVWTLTRRLIDTLGVPEGLQDVAARLRRAELGRMSRLRNSFNYDDARATPFEAQHSDFPDAANEPVVGSNRPEEFEDQLQVVGCLAELCRAVLERAGLNVLLGEWASARRIKNGIEAVA